MVYRKDPSELEITARDLVTQIPESDYSNRFQSLGDDGRYQIVVPQLEKVLQLAGFKPVCHHYLTYLISTKLNPDLDSTIIYDLEVFHLNYHQSQQKLVLIEIRNKRPIENYNKFLDTSRFCELKDLLIDRVRFNQGVGNIYFVPDADWEIKRLESLKYDGTLFDFKSRQGRRRVESLARVKKDSLGGDAREIITRVIQPALETLDGNL